MYRDALSNYPSNLIESLQPEIEALFSRFFTSNLANETSGDLNLLSLMDFFKAIYPSSIPVSLASAKAYEESNPGSGIDDIRKILLQLDPDNEQALLLFTDYLSNVGSNLELIDNDQDLNILVRNSHSIYKNGNLINGQFAQRYFDIFLNYLSIMTTQGEKGGKEDRENYEKVLVEATKWLTQDLITTVVPENLKEEEKEKEIHTFTIQTTTYSEEESKRELIVKIWLDVARKLGMDSQNILTALLDLLLPTNLKIQFASTLILRANILYGLGQYRLALKDYDEIIKRRETSLDSEGGYLSALVSEDEYLNALEGRAETLYKLKYLDEDIRRRSNRSNNNVNTSFLPLLVTPRIN
jgi:tetratricopeptide (TPR) repeat protein